MGGVWCWAGQRRANGRTWPSLGVSPPKPARDSVPPLLPLLPLPAGRAGAMASSLRARRAAQPAREHVAAALQPARGAAPLHGQPPPPPPSLPPVPPAFPASLPLGRGPGGREGAGLGYPSEPAAGSGPGAPLWNQPLSAAGVGMWALWECGRCGNEGGVGARAGCAPPRPRAGSVFSLAKINVETMEARRAPRSTTPGCIALAASGFSCPRAGRCPCAPGLWVPAFATQGVRQGDGVCREVLEARALDFVTGNSNF